MRGPCACPRRYTFRLGPVMPTDRTSKRTGTRPPRPLYTTPCPYRTADGISSHSPIRLSKIIRTWEAFPFILRFGLQRSSGRTMLFLKVHDRVGNDDVITF